MFTSSCNGTGPIEFLRSLRKTSVFLLFIFLASGCQEREDLGTFKVKMSDPPSPESRFQARTGGDFVVNISPTAPRSDQDLRLVVLGSGEILSCSWERNGSKIKQANTTSLSKENYSKGDSIAVWLKMADGREGRGTVLIRNSLPRITSVPFTPSQFHRGVDISAEPIAVDSDKDPVYFRFLWRVNGEELPLADTPVLPGDRFRRGDRISLEITPFDDEEAGPVFQSAEIAAPNAPPRIISTPPAEFRGRSYIYQVEAEDADGDELEFFLIEAPSGMRVEPRSGQIYWSIRNIDAGVHNVRIEANDGNGGTGFQEFELNISIADQRG